MSLPARQCHTAAIAALLALPWALAPACAESLAAGGMSFEVGPVGFHLRTGAAGASRAELDSATAAEGEWSVRLAAAPGEDIALELPWQPLRGGAECTFSVHLRTDRPGLGAAVLALSPQEVVSEHRFTLTPEWRRYQFTFAAARGSTAWHRFEVRPAVGEEGGGSVWVDAVQLDRGPAAPFAPQTALAVTVRSPDRLRQAGEAEEFGVRVRVPGGRGDVGFRWQLDNGFGRTVASGRDSLSLGPRGVGVGGVTFTHLDAGAWRLTAEAQVAGRALREDATVVVVTPELGGPDPWFGVTGAVGPANEAVLDLLHIGRNRGLVGPEGNGAIGPALQAQLTAHRRAGVVATGWLPAETSEDSAALVGRLRRLVRVWEWPPGADAATAEQARAAAPGLVLQQRRVPGNPQAPDGGAAMPDELVLDIGSAVPETAGGRGVAALLADTGTAAAAVGLLAGPWPAEAWDQTFAAGPARRGALPALAQASCLARAALLARAAGAAWFVYGGAPVPPPGLPASLAGHPGSGALSSVDGRPLPALAALDQVMDRLRGRQFAERVPLAPGVECLQFAGRRPLAVVWQWQQPSEDARLRLAVEPDELAVTDLFGSPVRVPGDAQGARLRLGPHPLYLEARRLNAGAFAAALRQGRVTGLRTITADWVRRDDGSVALRLRNRGGEAVTARVQPSPAVSPIAVEVPPGGESLVTGQVLHDFDLFGTASAGGVALPVPRLPSVATSDDEADHGWRVSQPVQQVAWGVAPEPAELRASLDCTHSSAGLRLVVDVRSRPDPADAAEVVLLRDEEDGAGPRTVTVLAERAGGSVAVAGSATGAVTGGEDGWRVTVTVPWQALGLAAPVGHPRLWLGLAVRDGGAADGAGASGQDTVLSLAAPNAARTAPGRLLNPLPLGWLVLRTRWAPSGNGLDR